MPQKPVDDYWKERVKTMLGADPAKPPGPRAIWRQLQAEAKVMDERKLLEVGYPPSERSITRIRNTEWNPLPEAERRGYRELHWPETFQQGDLPWEASAAALELLNVCRKVDPFARYLEARTEEALGPLGMHWWRRPSIRLARWYWHVTQAAPDLPAVAARSFLSPHSDILSRHDIAVVLAAWETRANAPQTLRDGIEMYLSFAPWRTPEHAIEYSDQVERGLIPGLTLRDFWAYAVEGDPAGELMLTQVEDWRRKHLGQ